MNTNIKRSLALASVSALFVSPVFADNTDTEQVTVSGDVVAALELSVTNLTMPSLVIPSTVDTESDTTVTLTCGATDAANTVAYTQNGNPYADGTASAGNPVVATSANVAAALGSHTGTCAVLSVTGDSTYSFVLNLGNITQPSTGGITLSALTCRDAGGNSVVDGASLALVGGSHNLRCGATATADNTAADYSDGSFDATVTYD